MLAIFKKEIRTYFTSMTGYIFLAGLVLVSAYYFVYANIYYTYANYTYAISSTSIILMVLVPVLTMRLFADEANKKTDQLLYTAPLTVLQIVAGKFLAALSLFLIGMAITVTFPLILSNYGELPTAEIIGAFVGYILLGVCCISVGIFVSAKTENQIVAAVASVGIIFLLFMLSSIASVAPTSRVSSVVALVVIGLVIAYYIFSRTKSILVALVFLLIYAAACGGAYLLDETLYDGIITKILNWFSLNARFTNFANGLLKVSDIVYYITFAFAFVYLTANAIEKRRWN